MKLNAIHFFILKNESKYMKLYLLLYFYQLSFQNNYLITKKVLIGFKKKLICHKANFVIIDEENTHHMFLKKQLISFYFDYTYPNFKK